jgi:hypothetical protein
MKGGSTGTASSRWGRGVGEKQRDQRGGGQGKRCLGICWVAAVSCRPLTTVTAWGRAA